MITEEDWMAKYVLVAFEDDRQAAGFIEKVNKATESGKSYGLAGVFQKPTSWCECPRVPDTKLRTELARGKRTGLMIHRACKKPRRTAQRPLNLLGGEFVFDGVRVSFDLGENGEILRNFPLTINRGE